MSKPTEIADAIGYGMGAVLADVMRLSEQAKTPEELADLTGAVLTQHVQTLRTAPHAAARLQLVVLRAIERGLADTVAHFRDGHEEHRH